MTYGEQYTLVPGPGIVPSWTGSYSHDGQIRQVIHSDDQVYSVNLAQGEYLKKKLIIIFFNDNIFNLIFFQIIRGSRQVLLHHQKQVNQVRIHHH